MPSLSLAQMRVPVVGISYTTLACVIVCTLARWGLATAAFVCCAPPFGSKNPTAGGRSAPPLRACLPASNRLVFQSAATNAPIKTIEMHKAAMPPLPSPFDVLLLLLLLLLLWLVLTEVVVAVLLWLVPTEVVVAVLLWLLPAVPVRGAAVLPNRLLAVVDVVVDAVLGVVNATAPVVNAANTLGFPRGNGDDTRMTESWNSKSIW
jgi:hypothetical protein